MPWVMQVLPASEVTLQADHITRLQQTAKPLTDPPGLFCAVADEIQTATRYNGRHPVLSLPAIILRCDALKKCVTVSVRKRT